MVHPVSMYPEQDDAKSAVKDFVHLALVIPAVEPDGSPHQSVYQPTTFYQPGVSISAYWIRIASKWPIPYSRIVHQGEGW